MGHVDRSYTCMHIYAMCTCIQVWDGLSAQIKEEQLANMKKDRKFGDQLSRFRAQPPSLWPPGAPMPQPSIQGQGLG